MAAKAGVDKAVRHVRAAAASAVPLFNQAPLPTARTAAAAMPVATLFDDVREVTGTTVRAMDTRKKVLKALWRANNTEPILDAFHGEMNWSLCPEAGEAVCATMEALVDGTHTLAEADGTLYDKRTPRVLRELAVTHTFDRLLEAGIPVQPEEVLVAPYSALAMFDAILQSLNKLTPGGRLLCPAGFYKDHINHIDAAGLKLMHVDADPADNCKLRPDVLLDAVRVAKQSSEGLAGLNLTIPGNPLVAEYSQADVNGIAEVCELEDVKVVVDASFDKILPPYPPIASGRTATGEAHSMYDRTMTVVGMSKAYMAFGPLKMGAAACGDAAWRRLVQSQLVLTFQRETTALAAAVLENTPITFLDTGRNTTIAQMAKCVDHVHKLNAGRATPVLEIVGEAKYGPFMLVTLPQHLLDAAGITRGHELTEVLLAVCGLDTVSSDRVGLDVPAVRLNVACPRVTAEKDARLGTVALDRVAMLGEHIENGFTLEQWQRTLPEGVVRALNDA